MPFLNCIDCCLTKKFMRCFTYHLQTLKDDFRLKYCQLWKSIIDRNMTGIKKYSEALGTGELFPLFACMITGRSWNSLNKGITEESFTKEEVRPNCMSSCRFKFPANVYTLYTLSKSPHNMMSMCFKICI